MDNLNRIFNFIITLMIYLGVYDWFGIDGVIILGFVALGCQLLVIEYFMDPKYRKTGV